MSFSRGQAQWPGLMQAQAFFSSSACFSEKTAADASCGTLHVQSFGILLLKSVS